MAGDAPSPLLGAAAGRAAGAVLVASLAAVALLPSVLARLAALYAAAEAAYFLLFRHRCVDLRMGWWEG